METSISVNAVFILRRACRSCVAILGKCWGVSSIPSACCLSESTSMPVWPMLGEQRSVSTCNPSLCWSDSMEGSFLLAKIGILTWAMLRMTLESTAMLVGKPGRVSYCKPSVRWSVSLEGFLIEIHLYAGWSVSMEGFIFIIRRYPDVGNARWAWNGKVSYWNSWVWWCDSAAHGNVPYWNSSHCWFGLVCIEGYLTIHRYVDARVGMSITSR